MPNCQYSQEVFPDEDNYMICYDCGGWTCIKCDTVKHPGITCAENVSQQAEKEARNSQEEASSQYLSFKTKVCPKCGIHTDKYEGCDHVICK